MPRSLRRLLVFNLATDAEDPILGFTTAWLRALGARVGDIDVVTMRVGRVDLPPNVHVQSVGKERGYGEPRRVVEFYRILVRLLRTHRYDACFAHMMPLFAVLASPLLRARRIRTTLWYAHAATGPMVRAAARTVAVVVTPSPESFRVRTRRDIVRVVGHGIDTKTYPLVVAEPVPPYRLLALGRVAPVKRLELLVRALPSVEAALGTEVGLRLVGPVDNAYAEGLMVLARRLGCENRVSIPGPRSYDKIGGVMNGTTVAMNVSATGSVDKAVLEAMACGVPVVVANEAFGFLPDVCLAEPTASDVAEKVVAIARMSPAARQSLGQDLRQMVEADHSLERLADLLVGQILVEPCR